MSEMMLTKVKRRPRLCRIVTDRFIDILARISVYTVQSSNSVHTRLITQVLPPKTALPNTLIMIILDWTKPWTFVDQLELWMKWIDDWSKTDNGRELEVAREEGRERRMSVQCL
jgi:dynein light intermediate chain 1